MRLMPAALLIRRCPVWNFVWYLRKKPAGVLRKWGKAGLVDSYANTEDRAINPI